MPTRSKPSSDAVSMLKEDHQKVDGLLEKFEKAKKPGDKKEIVETICKELTVHAQIEEEIFYPAVRKKVDMADLLDEAKVEHTSIKQLIAELEEMNVGDELYDAKVTVLGEYVKHHVEEEEGEMFPAVESAKIDLAALGEEMAKRKQQLHAELAASAAE